MSEYELSVGVYSQNDLSIVSGSGALVQDSEGKEYIDCVGGHGVMNVGHANEAVAKAVQQAWDGYAFATSRHPHPTREELFKKLAEKMPKGISKFFLSNSGTEAVEAALKFARLATGKQKILAAKRSFHGRTLGALSVTWKPEFREPFEPLLPGVDFFAFNKAETLEEKIDAETAAVILEPIQGEGGIHAGTKEFFAEIRKLCDQHGALLIIDEVQSGICRTGKFLALEHFDIQPDIVCLAKALAGGYPIGVTAIRSDLFGDKKVQGLHASTFGGNIPACAAALAVLDFCEKEKLAKQAEEKGKFLKKELEKLISAKPLVSTVNPPDIWGVKEVRGIGLMIAVELTVPAKPIVDKLQEEGVLVLPTGPKAFRLLPPLVITEEQIKKVTKSITNVLK
ncbi:MAG: acetylornithine/succinylornithine family transaminase [Patescibacteria group bacterium]